MYTACVRSRHRLSVPCVPRDVRPQPTRTQRLHMAPDAFPGRRFSAEHSIRVAAAFIGISFVLAYALREWIRSSPKLVLATGVLASLWSVYTLSLCSAFRVALLSTANERRRTKPLGWIATVLSGAFGGLLGSRIHAVCFTTSVLLYAVWIWELQIPEQ